MGLLLIFIFIVLLPDKPYPVVPMAAPPFPSFVYSGAGSR